MGSCNVCQNMQSSFDLSAVFCFLWAIILINNSGCSWENNIFFCFMNIFSLLFYHEGFRNNGVNLQQCLPYFTGTNQSKYMSSYLSVCINQVDYKHNRSIDSTGIRKISTQSLCITPLNKPFLYMLQLLPEQGPVGAVSSLQWVCLAFVKLPRLPIWIATEMTKQKVIPENNIQPALCSARPLGKRYRGISAVRRVHVALRPGRQLYQQVSLVGHFVLPNCSTLSSNISDCRSLSVLRR